MAVDRPLEYAKGSLKVSPCGPHERLDSQVDSGDKSNGSDASFASMCFDRVAELRDQGFEESDIRAVTSSTYVGELFCFSGCRVVGTNKVVLAAADTVRGYVYQST